MRTRRRATIEDLRLAVQCLPRATRIAMLEGLRSNEIIVGAYSNRDGICPMLAAHRNGGRTSMISFARAWDRFALPGGRRARPRRATPRELRVLETQLEASLLEEETGSGELAAAIASHKHLVARREAEPACREAEPARREAEPARREAQTQQPGDPDRSAELRSQPGWAWTRVVRSYNEYERALAWLESERLALQARERDALATREHQPA